MRTFTKIKAGFSLVEIVLALSIVAFCMATLMALMPVGIQHYHKADTQSAMANLAAMVVRDLQSAPSGATSTTSQFKFQFPPAGSFPPGSNPGPTPQVVYVDDTGQASDTAPYPTKSTIQPVATSIYRISVSIYSLPPTTSPSVTATLATIVITTPAFADPTPSLLPTKYSDRFETTVALNRN